MEKCIVKENGYRVKDLNDKSEAVLAEGSSFYDTKAKNDTWKKYRLITNEVDFYWGHDDLKTVILLISYKGTELVRYENPNFQLVIDYLNKYEGISRKDIEKLVNEAQEVSKTQLESEIEVLKEEKVKLLEQISILKEIEEKKEEIKVLLTKLND